MENEQDSKSPTTTPLPPAHGSDARPSDELSAEVRALIKPIVMEMHKRGWTDVRLLKSGTRVMFSAQPNAEVRDAADRKL